MNNFYVYIHYKLDTGEPFYVGKGTKDRDKVKWGRSKWWSNTANKHGYYSERVEYFKNESDAFTAEINLINELKSESIKLCNLTEGGEGASGMKHTDKTKEQLQKLLKGNKNRSGVRNSKEHNDAISKAQSGNNSTNCKGIITATNVETGEWVSFVGKSEIVKHGFETASVYRCIAGKQKYIEVIISKENYHEHILRYHRL